MESHFIDYRFEGKRYRISKRELYSVLSSTGECLSPAFNMQIQMLIQLIEIIGEDVDTDSIRPEQIAALDAHFPGLTLETLRIAIKAYHTYAANMYYI